jgi:hypothetical protein
MGKQLKWSCSTCGMSSGRKYSVQRHILNYNIHSGAGKVIPFIEYTIGTRQGKYQPQQVPNNTYSQPKFLDRIHIKITQELENQIANEIASRIFKDLSVDQSVFNNLKSQAVAYIFKNNYYRIFKEWRELM